MARRWSCRKGKCCTSRQVSRTRRKRSTTPSNWTYSARRAPERDPPSACRAAFDRSVRASDRPTHAAKTGSVNAAVDIVGPATRIDVEAPPKAVDLPLQVAVFQFRNRGELHAHLLQ